MNPERNSQDEAEAILEEQGSDRGQVEYLLEGDPLFMQSEAAPGFPRARDFNETPASEWAKLEGEV
jgi:hypothetical protein